VACSVLARADRRTCAAACFDPRPLDPALKQRLDDLTKGWRLGDAVR